MAVAGRHSWIRRELPGTAEMVRCARCGRVLAMTFSFVGRVVVRCSRCKIDNVFQSADGKLMHQGASELIEPARVFELVEARWLDAIKRLRRERAETAKGLRFQVFLRDGFRCQYCGRSVQEGALLHVDHVVPRARGGADSLDNLVTACASCNLGKGATVLAP